ncbi:MAG: radical SAM protein [Desulfobacter sp.]|nr:radical SAM protein [Desulfobacter sp.]WDP87319.1 MAG: radical SAM protein [Desulfobacter sp.]
MTAPLVIPYFIPHQGCPHQCVFCNQSIITGKKQSNPKFSNIDDVIREYLSFKGNRTQVELAFFGGNFLGLSKAKIRALLLKVKPYQDRGLIQRIRCSTRPDTISEEVLDLVRGHGLDLVELGVQSMDDAVLEISERGHTRKDTLRAIQTLKAAGIKVGVQVMAGLPGDSLSRALATVRALSELSPDMARIYPVLVLAGSRLAQWYASGEYTPLDLNQAVEQVKQMLEIFKNAGVFVARMGLQAGEMMDDPDQMIAGPWHPAFGHLVYSALMFDRACELIEGIGEELRPKQLSLKVHPRSLSRLQGDRKTNLEKLRRRYPGIEFSILCDKGMDLDQVGINPNPPLNFIFV